MSTSPQDMPPEWPSGERFLLYPCGACGATPNARGMWSRATVVEERGDGAVERRRERRPVYIVSCDNPECREQAATEGKDPQEVRVQWNRYQKRDR